VYGSGGTISHDASWALPLFARSTLATLRLARTHASVIEEPVDRLDIQSLVGVREFGLSQPVIDNARQRLTVGLTHSLRHNATTILGGEPFPVVPGSDPSGTTRLEAWRLSQDFTLRLDRHVLALRASYIRGRNNLLPAPEVPLVPATRYGLWQAQAQAALALGEGDTQLLLRAQLQRSPQHLLPLEQMAIGGRHTVRGYRENTLVRDNAWAASAELHWPLWRNDDLRAAVRLVPFVDAGAAWNRDESRRRLASAGLGLVLTLADFEGELYYGRRLERRPTDTRGDLQDHGIHIALRYRPF
jgi:hemolysin activation/secretion protein